MHSSRFFVLAAFDRLKGAVQSGDVSVFKEAASNKRVDLDQIDKLHPRGGLQSMNPLFDLVVEVNVLARKARNPYYYVTNDNKGGEAEVIEEVKTHLPKLKEAYDLLVENGADPDYTNKSHYPHSARKQAVVVQSDIDQSDYGLTDVTRPLFQEAMSILKHMEEIRPGSKMKI